MVLRAAGFPVPKLLFWNFVASLTCVAGVGGSWVSGGPRVGLSGLSVG